MPPTRTPLVTGEAASTANLHYWFPADVAPLDGGGVRAVAWSRALRALGYEVRHLGVLDRPGSEQTPATPLRRLKRLAMPMPVDKRIGPLPTGDLTVLTVPATFPHALRRTPSPIIFDWMDRWSVSAATMGSTSLLGRPGGEIQAALWRRRERRLPARVAANTYAGYDDWQTMRALVPGTTHVWAPTPILEWPRPRVPGDQNEVPTKVGFLSNLAYEPNQMSLRQFLREHLTPLGERNIEIVVAGYNSELAAAWGLPISILGEVADLHDFYNSIDVALAPIEHGSGIKVKAIEAMTHGVPVIGSDHVRSGFPPDLRPYVLDTEALYAAELRDLTRPPADLVRSYFSEESFIKRIAEAVKTVA